MTFFLDGPPPPARSADKVPSKAPTAAPVSGARQAPEPSGLTGIPVAAPKAAPAAERKKRNTRLAAIRASALRVAERQEQEVEAAAASTTSTATAATVRDEDTAPADPAPSMTATASAAPAAAKESEMSDTERMLDAMRAEPARKWKREELCELRGTNLVLTGQALNWLKKKGVVENCGRGLWRLASGAKAEEPAPPKKSKSEKPAKARRAARAQEEPEAQEEQVDASGITDAGRAALAAACPPAPESPTGAAACGSKE